MKGAGKQYAPVGPFEKATGICPLYVAWMIQDELEEYLRATLPAGVQDELAWRAEQVFARNARWRRLVRGARGRGWLRAFMRHWLSALLHRKRPDLFRKLPESYKIGHPL